MNHEQPSYYAIIPASVRYDKSLKANEKLLYGEITCLANAKGYCYASNSFFAELYEVDKATVSRWISHLEKQGYIKTQIIKNSSNQILERRIYITNFPAECKKINTPFDEKVTSPVDEKSKENNTSKNNTSINNIFGDTAEVSQKPEVKQNKEPRNDYEKVEKRYTDNYEKLRQKGILTLQEPSIKYGQCRKLMKDLLRIMEVDTIMLVLDRAMSDDFVLKGGYNLSTILSATVVNRLANSVKVRAIDRVDAVSEEALRNLPF